MEWLSSKMRGPCAALLGFLFSLIVGLSSAEPAEMTSAQVRAAVETWVRTVAPRPRLDAVVAVMQPQVVAGDTFAYVVHLNGGGFCLAGADERVLPVYLYSSGGEYDSGDVNLRFILNDIVKRTQYWDVATAAGSPLSAIEVSTLGERALFWRELMSGQMPTRVRKSLPTTQGECDVLELTFTPHWHQHAPYNDECPSLPWPTGNERSVVGCVATAMSQVMYYWQWPTVGDGPWRGGTYNYRWGAGWNTEPLTADPLIPGGGSWWGRLQWVPTNGGELQMSGYWDNSCLLKAWQISDDPAYHNALYSLWLQLTPASTSYGADIASAQYDWTVIADRVSSIDPGAAEVAELCFHAGLAVGMDYGVKESGADTKDVESAMPSNFRYDWDLASTPIAMGECIVEELQWLRPIIMRGRSDSGGHAWVVYGYDKVTDPVAWLFKVNYGHDNASEDDWWALDNMPTGYTSDQQAVFYIAPRSVVRFVNTTGGLVNDGSPDDPFRSIAEAYYYAPDSTTLIFRAGSTNSVGSDGIVIARPLVLKGRAAVVR